MLGLDAESNGTRFLLTLLRVVFPLATAFSALDSSRQTLFLVRNRQKAQYCDNLSRYRIRASAKAGGAA